MQLFFYVFIQDSGADVSCCVLHCSTEHTHYAEVHIQTQPLPAVPLFNVSGPDTVGAGLLHLLLVCRDAQSGEATLPVSCQNEELWPEQ